MLIRNMDQIDTVAEAIYNVSIKQNDETIKTFSQLDEFVKKIYRDMAIAAIREK